jgi:hypothetical protein
MGRHKATSKRELQTRKQLKRTIGLLLGDFVNVEAEALAVNGDNLPSRVLTSLLATTDNGNLVIFPDGDGANLRRQRHQFLVHTPYFWRSSFDKEADMILRRMFEGAVKWAFLLLRRDEETSFKSKVN